MKELVCDSILLEYEIAAPVDRVFTAITEEIGKWWTHSFRAEKKVVLEAHVGGRFYEDWGNGTGALYATVTYLEPGCKMCLTGPMGMSGVVACAMDILGTVG
jgi:uncharacterized protein YndB with AHSA1/START domain